METIDLAPFMVQATTDPAAAIQGLVDKLNEITVSVAAIDSAESTKTEKDASPLETMFAKNEQGLKDAESFLRENVFGPIVDYCDDDPENTFHMLKALTAENGILKYLRSEVAYFNLKATPKTPKASERMSLKRRFNEIRAFLILVVRMVSGLGYDWKNDANLTADKKGEPALKIGGMRGIRKDDDAASASGRFAKVYSLEFTIDGELMEDWGVSDIVRAIWHGDKRIGKTAKDLAEILDKDAPGWMTTGFKGKTLKINGHTIKIERSSAE